MKANIIFISENLEYIISAHEQLNSEFWQRKLRNFHKKQRTIRCGCGVWLSVVLKDNKYFLRSYPKQPVKHKADCLYDNENAEFLTDEGEFSLKIFDELNQASNKPDSSQHVPSARENKAAHTFTHFCNLLLEKTQAYAFNYVNASSNRFIYHPSWQDFFKLINKAEINVKGISSLSALKKALKDKGIFLGAGITYQSAEELLSVKKLRLQGKDAKEINLSISKYALLHAVRSVQIFENFIRPPYFYICTSRNYLISRLFIYPISDFGAQLAFIESEKEREMCKDLVEKKKVFLKPVGDEYNRLAKKENRPYYPLFFRPDFFIFEEGSKPVIVEVSGHINKEYEAQLADKEKYYKILESFEYQKL